MQFGLASDVINQLKNVFGHYPEVEKVKIFGSRAIGNFRANSDIDLVLWGQIDEALLAKIAQALDDLPLPYLFDVKCYSDLSHLGLREHIDQYAKDLYLKSLKSG